MENEPLNTPPAQAPKLKRTIAIIVGLLLVGAISAGAVLLLRGIAPKTSQDSTQGATTSAVEIIKALRAPGAIKSLEKFTQQTNAPDTARVIYKAEGRVYTTSTPAKESILFVAPTPDIQTDAATAEDDIANFIIQNGYERTENTGLATVSPPKYLTFKSPIGTCQLRSAPSVDTQQTVAFYEVTCVDSTAISQEYSNLEMLFSLYKEMSALPAFETASRSIAIEDNKSLSIVALNGDGTKKSLLFAAIDNNWEFIGDLSDSSAAESNGKYSISNEIRSKIDDARWEGFLKKMFR